MNSPPRCNCPKRCGFIEIDQRESSDFVEQALQSYNFDFDDSQNDHRFEQPSYDDEADFAFSRTHLRAPQPSLEERLALADGNEWVLVPKGGKVKAVPTAKEIGMWWDQTLFSRPLE